MTRKQFEAVRQSIEREKFEGDYADPITYGLQRALFEKRKFKRLISAARSMNLQTARSKAEQWKRQLERAEQSHARFVRLQKELKMLRPHVLPNVKSAAAKGAQPMQCEG